MSEGRSEVSIDSKCSLCDPHHHLMERDWVAYSLSDLLGDLRSVPRIESTVYMECSNRYRTEGPEHLRPLGEVEYVISLQAPPGVMSGVVAAADLRLERELDEYLDAASAIAADRLKGVRFSTAWDPHLENHGRSAKMLADPRVSKSVPALTRRRLTLDCWLYGDQLLDLAELAEGFPDQIFVLDHLGSPLLANLTGEPRISTHSRWRSNMGVLSKLPNVVLKIGGLAMDLHGAPWARGEYPSSAVIAEFWEDDVRWCIDHFSPQRCMFESNFPIDRLTVNYTTLWNSYQLLVAPYSECERSQLLFETAASTYRLPR